MAATRSAGQSVLLSPEARLALLRKGLAVHHQTTSRLTLCYDYKSDCLQKANVLCMAIVCYSRQAGSCRHIACLALLALRRAACRRSRWLQQVPPWLWVVAAVTAKCRCQVQQNVRAASAVLCAVL